MLYQLSHCAPHNYVNYQSQCSQNACQNSKQCRPISDCFFRSSLILVCTWRSSLILFCTVCLGHFGRQLAFKILEHIGTICKVISVFFLFWICQWMTKPSVCTMKTQTISILSPPLDLRMSLHWVLPLMIWPLVLPSFPWILPVSSARYPVLRDLWDPDPPPPLDLRMSLHCVKPLMIWPLVLPSFPWILPVSSARHPVLMPMKTVCPHPLCICTWVYIESYL